MMLQQIKKPLKNSNVLKKILLTQKLFTSEVNVHMYM